MTFVAFLLSITVQHVSAIHMGTHEEHVSVTRWGGDQRYSKWEIAEFDVTPCYAIENVSAEKDGHALPTALVRTPTGYMVPAQGPLWGDVTIRYTLTDVCEGKEVA